MKIENRQIEKFSFSKSVMNILEGLFVGFASAVPFFQVKSLKETMSLREYPFRRIEKKEKNKVLLTNGIDDDPYKVSLLKELGILFSLRFTYLLGAILGFALFFFIPFGNLLSSYPFALYGSLALSGLGFLIFEVAKMFKNEEKKRHLLPSLFIFLVSGAVFYVYLKFFSSLLDPIWTSDTFLSLYFVIAFLISGFVLVFSGMGISTIFFVSGNFISVSNYFNHMLYEKGPIKMALFCLIGFLVGGFFALLLKRRGDFALEKASLNSGIYVAGIFYIMTTYIKPPYLTSVSTVLAQWLTIGTCFAVSLLVPIALGIHQFLSKKDKIDKESL